MLGLLAVSVALTVLGVNGVVCDDQEVISGNRLDRLLAQREVDHLTWTNKLVANLNDPKAEKISVEKEFH